MHIFSWICLLITACIGDVSAVEDENSGIVGVDLVFPRNETYAPTQFFPVVWAVHNPRLAELLNVHVELELQGWNIFDNIGAGPRNSSFRLRWLDGTSKDPFFQYSPFQQLSAAANWDLDWKIYWNSCTNGSSFFETADGAKFTDFTQGSVMFTTKDATQQPDLMSDTTDTTCSPESGVAIKVAGTQGEGVQVCAVATSPDPTSTPTPCRVQIDSVAAASISSSITSQICRSVPIPVGCPNRDEDKKSAAQRLAVASFAGLLLVFGALVHSSAFRSH
jgi:hypothetical protein